MKRYRVKEIADLLGMTTQTLRRYDNLGIIAPARERESGYRTYQTLDFMQLMRLKSMRNYGFGLEESCKIYDLDLAGTAEIFGCHADALAAEIARLKKLEDQTRLQYARLKDCEELTHMPYKTERRPALKVYLYMNVHDLKDYEETKKELSGFIEIMPPMRSCVLYRLDDLPCPQYEGGLCAFDRELIGVDPSLMAKCISYPSCDCITTVVQNTGVSTAASEQDSAKTAGQLRVESMLRLVDENGFELAGDIIGEIHHMWKEINNPYVPVQHRFHHYIKMWIPVRPRSGECKG